MKLDKIINIMENLAPSKLKCDSDNVGLMVGDRNSNVKKVLIALDCTLDVIEEAKDIGANLIITHHPLLYIKPSTITTDTLLGRKVIDLIKSDISLYSSHTNLDTVKGGMNDSIVEILGFEYNSVLEESEYKEFNGVGIGRVVELQNEIPMEALVDNIKLALNIRNLRHVKGGNSKVKKIAIVNGSGEDFLELAKVEGVECIITGDTTYHYVSDYKEMGMDILDIGHFGSEWTPFIAVCEKIKEEINKIEDMDVVISTKMTDPYEFV